MEIRENNEICIYAPLSATINEYESSRLITNIANDSRKIGIDLINVSDCTIDFIENLKQISSNKKISLFNIPSDIFILFNTMNIDKSVHLYVNEQDFIEGSRQLLNRNFSIVL